MLAALTLVFIALSGQSDSEPAPIADRSAIPNLTRPEDGRTEFVRPARWPLCAEGCHERPAPFELSTAYLYPALQRGIDHYVTSCWRDQVQIQLKSEREVTIRRPGFRWRDDKGRARIPLEPGQSFRIQREAQTYRVRCLPENFPGWDFERLQKSSRDFYSVAFGRSNDNEDKRLNPFVVVFDKHGVPVWWQAEDEGTLGGQVVEYEGEPYIYWRQEGGRRQGFIEDHHQLHALDGKLAHQFESPIHPTDGHEFNLRANGDVWLVSYVPRPGTDFSDIGGPASAYSAEGIIEQVRDGKTIWRWSTRRAIHTYEARRSLEKGFGEKDDGSFQDPFDRIHLNSVEPAGRQVIVSMRNTDGVYAIDKRSGEIVWKLGGEETPESLGIIGDPNEYPSGAQHDARLLPDGTVSVFDNRTGLEEPPRVTRWRIDEKDMTATLVEAYEDPLAPASPATGSARFSEDGSLFVYWGDSYFMTEFSPEGELAFRLSLDGMAYRAFPVPDGLVEYRDFDRGMDAKQGE